MSYKSVSTMKFISAFEETFVLPLSLMRGVIYKDEETPNESEQQDPGTRTKLQQEPEPGKQSWGTQCGPARGKGKTRTRQYQNTSVTGI